MDPYSLFNYIVVSIITIGIVAYGIHRSKNKDLPIPFEGTFLSLYYTKKDREAGKFSNKTKTALIIMAAVVLILLFVSGR